MRYGAKGAKVMPGTPKGDAYCARSLGQMRDHPEAAKDPCSPLRLSRKRWACKGAKSMKHNPSIRERSVAVVHNPDSLIAPNPTPFGEVIFDDQDELVLDEPKLNARSRKTKEGEDGGLELLAQINNAALRLTSQTTVEGLAPIREAIVAFIPKASGEAWRNAAIKFLWWLDSGCPLNPAKAFKSANKLVKPEMVERMVLNKKTGVKAPKMVKANRTVFSVFGRGNSKLPYTTFSTLPGITCPGAGSCLTNPEKFPNDRNTDRVKKGGWCYSFKAWRYPAAYFRQLGNTLLIKMPYGRAEIARLFGMWAKQEAVIEGGETVRLYVDGDIESETTLDFWMRLCDAYPHVRAYGYSKSWHIFNKYDRVLKAEGREWPKNYTLNLSEGSAFWNNKETHEKTMSLPIARHDFGVVQIDKADGKKIPQNILILKKGASDMARELRERIAVTTDEVERKKLISELNDAKGKESGVYAAIARLEVTIKMATNPDQIDKLTKTLAEWKDTAALLETTRDGTISEETGDEGDDGKAKAYIIVTELNPETGEMEEKKKAISIPDEFWSRNPEYTEAVTAKARQAKNPDGTLKYPPIHYTRPDGTPAVRDNFFVCPGKCGNCLGKGRHACGDIRLKRPIVIGLH